MTEMFDGTQGYGKVEVVMKLNCSLYGLVQAPLYWYNHLKDSLAKVGFKRSDLDSCLFYGHLIVVLIYLDDCLFFGPYQKKIDEMIAKLQSNGLTLTVEKKDAYAFLGVDVKPRANGGYTMMQEGLTEKVLNTTGMQECNRKATPAGTTSLGTDEEGATFKEKWNYASVVGILLYLSLKFTYRHSVFCASMSTIYTQP